MNGNWGRVLEIDLSTEQQTVHRLGEETMQQYLGGSALGTKLLYDGVPPNVDPLSPKNLLIFSTGVFQSTAFPGSAKWIALSKSPLTGTFCASAAGANFGPMLKRTGFDALVFTGRADHPVAVAITDDTAELRDATTLWGKDAIETNNLLRKAMPKCEISTVTIGQAGEKLVAMACLVVDGHSFAGRGGLGAVMGSKNIKAVVVSGRRTPAIADLERVRTLSREAALKLQKNTRETYHKHGTAIDVAFCESVGDMPIKYWAGDTWAKGAERIGAPRFTEYLSARANPCFACPIGCHRHVTLVSSGKTIIEGPGPEYESLGLLGAACLVDDLDAIVIANDRCNRLGIDTISAGSAVAFSMECFERGLLTREVVGNLSLEWGNGKALIELVDQIGTRRGFGAIFANGIRQAAAVIGRDAMSLPVEVKGMDFPAHDPRTYFSLAINYATSTQGASHLRGFPHLGEIGMLIPEVGYNTKSEKFTMTGKPALAILYQDYAVVLDSLVDCCFMQICGLSLTKTIEALNAITGWDIDVQMLMQVGERGFNLQRLIDLRDGLTCADDRLPSRMFKAAKIGPRKGKIPTGFENALRKYYNLRGWSSSGCLL